MLNKYELPELERDDLPQDFAIKLRRYVFETKNQAARYFGVGGTTIGRYESEAGIQPPPGYLAALMKLGLDQAAGRTTAEVAEQQQFLLDQFRKLVQRPIDEYKWRDAFKSWAQLAQAADEYRLRHRAASPQAESCVAPGAPPANQAQPGWPAGIHDEPYYVLPQREQYLADMLAALRRPDGPYMVAIHGLGGVGKTALALELCRRARACGDFNAILGASARQVTMSGGRIARLRGTAIYFDDLLNTIARQLGHAELTTLASEQKIARISDLLFAQPYIILVDDVENIADIGEPLLRLRELLSSGAASRVVITGRKRATCDFVYSLPLSSLSKSDALRFLLAEAGRRKVARLLDTPVEILEQLCSACCGAPLALKLAAAQAEFLDIGLIIWRLRQAGSELYEFIFAATWSQLAAPSRRLLTIISQAAGASVSWEDLHDAATPITAEELASSIEELVLYSLLEVDASANCLRYGLQQLTRQFLAGDLPQLWLHASGRAVCPARRIPLPQTQQRPAASPAQRLLGGARPAAHAGATPCCARRCPTTPVRARRRPPRRIPL